MQLSKAANPHTHTRKFKLVTVPSTFTKTGEAELRQQLQVVLRSSSNNSFFSSQFSLCCAVTHLDNFLSHKCNLFCSVQFFLRFPSVFLIIFILLKMIIIIITKVKLQTIASFFFQFGQGVLLDCFFVFPCDVGALRYYCI